MGDFKKMYALLFSDSVVDRRALRDHAREEVSTSPLIRACASGNLSAVRGLLEGFWPFVQAFEKAIDFQVGRLPIKPLIQRFGQEKVKNFFAEARAAVREMHEEEGSHAELWRQGAREIGATLDAYASPQGVTALLQNAKTSDPVEFFCWLAGTEYIAEELAAYLCHSPAFVDLFSNQRWTWGDAHIAEHDGPSHLEIDEDLARAYYPATDPASVGPALFDKIRHCQQLFGAAASNVMVSLESVAA
jgi:hypothetical protein